MGDILAEFNGMVADSYRVYIGTKKSIKIFKEAFALVGIELSPATDVFYVIPSSKKTKDCIMLVDKPDLKIEILEKMGYL